MSRGGAPAGRGRGGAGRGRGGRPSIFTPQLLGGLHFGDIIAQSKEGDVLYPLVDPPETDWPSSLESKIAKTYNDLANEIKTSPFWIDPPTKTSSDIERYSDRFRPKSRTMTPQQALAGLHAEREYSKALLPPAIFEAILEKKSKRKSLKDSVAVAAKKRKLKVTDLDDVDESEQPPKDPTAAGGGGDDSQSDLEEEPEGLEEEEDYEDENDYADNYFDNGEDEDGGGGDALGGGGDEGYGGGGFMNSQRSSGDSPGEGGKKATATALRPVTIHQIIQADLPYPDAELMIDNVETKDVTFVACIRNVTKTTTNYSLVVEDGTGQIDVRKWIDAGGEDENEEEELEQNTYVRIIGVLKTFNGKRHVNGTHVKRLEDMNEILYHAVEVVYVHLYAKNGGPPSNRGGNVGGGGGAAARIASTSDHSNPYQNAAAESGGGGANAFNDFPVHQRKIMQFVAQKVEEGDAGEGVNINAIAKGVGGAVNKVRQDVMALVDDGHLYCTIDDDHVLGTA